MNRLSALLAAGLLVCAPAFAQDKQPAKDPKNTPATPAAPATPATPAKPADKGGEKPGGKAPAGDMAAEMAEWQKSAAPGKFHEWLKQMEGEWQVEMKFFGPDGSPMGGGTGTMTSKMTKGGRFLDQDFDGRFNGMFFRGGGTMGYNNLDKRFEATWTDSMSTGIMMMTGQADAAGKVLTMTGESTQPDGKKETEKEVTTIIDKNSYKSEFFKVAGGKDLKTMEIVYTKGKAADKKEEKKEQKKPADKK